MRKQGVGMTGTWSSLVVRLTWPACAQVRELNARKMEELEGINARVRATVSQKDARILALEQQVHEAEGRVEQYELLLQRQRCDLLS